MWDGLKQIFANPFIRGMAVLLLLVVGIGTVNYTLVTDYSGATFVDAVARTRFAANVHLASNLLTKATQLLVIRWLLPRKGPGFVIMVWALASVAALMVVVFSPDPHEPGPAGIPAVAPALILTPCPGPGPAAPPRTTP